MQTAFQVPNIRSGYQVDMGGTSCYWFEPEHPGEGHRTLLDVFDMYLNDFQWDKFIRPGSTVVDIGGHSGDTAVPMQYLSRGVVLSAEPNPRIKQHLDFNCNVNTHLGKFVTASEAVTTVDTNSLEIYDHNNDLCNGGTIDPTWSPELQERMRNMSGKHITVQGLTLQHLCEKYLTPEEIAKAEKLKGKIVSKETKEKLRISALKRPKKIMSEESKKKISESLKGKPRSEETKKKISIAHQGNKHCLGKKCSEETKKKISEKLKGRIISEESRLKMIATKLAKRNKL